MLWKRNNREFQYMLRRWKQRHSMRDGVRQNTVWKTEGVCFPMESMVMWPLWGWHFSVSDASMNRKETSFFLPQHPLNKESLKPDSWKYFRFGVSPGG